MSDKINRLIQQAHIDKERADRLLEEIKVMDEQINRLTRELAEAREAIRRYGDRTRMSFAPPELQQAIDDAFAARALKEKP